MLFHGSQSEVDFSETNPNHGRYDVCLTPSRDAAARYGETVHKVECDAYVGEMPDIREAVEMAVERGDAGPETASLLDGPYAYLAVDEPGVQKALVDIGVSAVRYDDEDPDNDRHECVRVLEPGHIETIAVD